MNRSEFYDALGSNSGSLAHHGILGQKWGKQNGPPYPLKGGDYSKSEETAIITERQKSKHNIYNKKHFDQVVNADEKLVTLSRDKNRTNAVDMFYASHTKSDLHQYNAFFNSLVDEDIYDENGNKIGTGECYKYKITNTLSKDIKVASEDSGADAFIDLYKNSRDFKNFVTDPERMQGVFFESEYKFKGYKEARESLENIRKSDVASEDDLRKVYRMFNYVIPSDGRGNERARKDVATQRARLFSELKKKGYSALLDTNDAIYASFKADSPVIVFDMDSIVSTYARRVNSYEKTTSELYAIGKVLTSLI